MYNRYILILDEVLKYLLSCRILYLLSIQPVIKTSKFEKNISKCSKPYITNKIDKIIILSRLIYPPESLFVLLTVLHLT